MRKRISITLKEEVIRRIDELSGETSESNRSRTIEGILENSLSSRSLPVVILAGDEQSLRETAGKPVILQILSFLGENHVSNVTICTTSAVSKEIRELVGSGQKNPLMTITYFDQKEKTGTASALKKLRNKLKGDFLLIYGDNFFEFNLGDLAKFHASAGVEATAALTTVKTPSDFGVVSLHGKIITAFNEKPKEAESHLVSMGIFVFNDAIFAQIPDSARSLEKDVFPGLCTRRKLAGCVFSGKWTPS